MGKKTKNAKKTRSKYFKWGLTAFLVIILSVLSIYTVLNISVLGHAIKSFMSMIMPIIDGFIVAYILSPLVDQIEDKIIYPFTRKHNIEINPKREKTIRGISVFTTLLIVFVLLFLFIKSVVPQLIESIQNIINQMPNYLDSLIVIANKILEELDLFQEKNIVSIVEHYYEDIMQFMQLNVMPSVNEWVRKLSSSVFSFIGALWNLLIGFFIAIYLLSSKERFRGQIKKMIYALYERERANMIVSDIRYIDKTFTSFVGGKIVDSIIIGLLCFIIMTCFNIPYTLLISVIIGVTNIIPFFGPFLGAIPSAILILLIDPIKALYFIIIIIVLQQLDGNFIGPMILGNSTGLSGFWVIFAITLFGGIWGIPGMFLGVPIFACIYAWVRRKMRNSLRLKKLTLNTDEYIELDYINKNDIIINKQPVTVNHEVLKKPKSDKKSIDIRKISTGLQNKIKDFMNNVIRKNTKDLTNTNETINTKETINDENIDVIDNTSNINSNKD